jgi:DNA-binding Lrp family transcriptional regulator
MAHRAASLATDGLFVTDEQLAAKLGVSADTLRPAIRTLEKRGFPRRDPLFGNKRFWPAVEAYLLSLYSVGTLPSAPDGVEDWSHK